MADYSDSVGSGAVTAEGGDDGVTIYPGCSGSVYSGAIVSSSDDDEE